MIDWKGYRLSLPVIVTGATGGIGRELVTALVHRSRPVIMAVRNVERGEEFAEPLRQQIAGCQIWVEELDLANTDSIKSFAERIKSAHREIGALVNNAGTMCRSYSTTPQGIEMTMAVNLHGTALLTELIAPFICRGGNIVFTTSLTRKFFKVDRLDIDEKPDRFGQLTTYGRSKAAVTLYAGSVAERFTNLVVNAADPGIVDSGMITMHRWFDPISNVVFRPFIRSPRQGAESALRALDAERSGHVYTRRGSSPLAPDLHTPAARELLNRLMKEISYHHEA